MRKIFFNLFLIVIICFSASFIPLNTSYFNFFQNSSIDFTLNKSPVEIETISYNYGTNLDDTGIVFNPTNLEFTINGNFEKKTFSLGNNYDMVLEVFDNNELIKKYTNTEFVTGLINTEDIDSQLKYSFDISQENLKLESGNYTLKFYSTAEIFNNVTPYEVSVSYLNSFNYVGSKDIVEDGYTYMTLYFPDYNYEYLIPVSRKIPSNSYSIRTVLNNLVEGPDASLGLNDTSPVPDVPKVWLSNGMATLYLPNDIGIYNQGSSLSQFALNSFINTLTSIDGIDRVKFLKGGREVETFFHGTYIKEPFEKNTYPKIYLGLKTKADRFLLAPVKAYENNMNIQQLIPKLFDSLKTCIVNDYHHKNLLSTIPENVTLLNYEYDNGLLTLNLSDNFLSAHSNIGGMQKMMLDSILYSFTSIPEITQVALTVNGKPIDSFNDIDISKPMTAPSFINIEME